MTHPKPPKFNIGDPVFHVSPESPQGMVIDIVYSYLTGIHEYLVTFDHSVASLQYYEHELQSHRNYAK